MTGYPENGASDDTVALAASAARTRRQRPLGTRQLAWNLGRAAAFVALAATLALRSAGEPGPGIGVLIVLVVVYAGAWRTGFETGFGVTVPSVLALGPMLVLLPPGWVPLAAAGGGVLADLTCDRRGRRVLGTLACTWSTIPPVMILTAGDPPTGWAGAPLFAVALLSWVVADALLMLFHQRVVLRNGAARPSRVIAMYRLEAPLGVLAFLGAVATDGFRYAFVLPFAVLVVFQQLTRERSRRIDHAAELSQAYRGTALLLGSVLDADDLYTGVHSRSVVEVARAVAEELGLTDGEQRQTEFAALLHDVGKIRVPKAILNKPVALTAEEWTLMRRHPDDGAAMLERVGGYLASVATFVRHHHERWDGGGYPAGLAGDAIPVVSRIIGACDAFCAMTTDRPYRAALDLDVALGELRNGAGTQFDPAVVTALCAVVAREPAVVPPRSLASEVPRGTGSEPVGDQQEAMRVA